MSRIKDQWVTISEIGRIGLAEKPMQQGVVYETDPVTGITEIESRYTECGNTTRPKTAKRETFEPYME